MCSCSLRVYLVLAATPMYPCRKYIRIMLQQRGGSHSSRHAQAVHFCLPRRAGGGGCGRSGILAPHSCLHRRVVEPKNPHGERGGGGRACCPSLHRRWASRGDAYMRGAHGCAGMHGWVVAGQNGLGAGNGNQGISRGGRGDDARLLLGITERRSFVSCTPGCGLFWHRRHRRYRRRP